MAKHNHQKRRTKRRKSRQVAIAASMIRKASSGYYFRPRNQPSKSIVLFEGYDPLLAAAVSMTSVDAPPPSAPLWIVITADGHLHYFRRQQSREEVQAMGGTQQWKALAVYQEEVTA